MSILEVDNLRKTYGKVVAIDGVSLDVVEGETFGIMGPNGAGKTTLVECMEGLRKPDSGTVRLMGMNPFDCGRALRDRIGIQLQEAALQDRITVRDAVDLYSSFYSRSVDQKRLLEQLGLAGHENRPFAQLSNGQKQRLFIALSLINEPDVMFLDELTAGLDPHARHAMWDLIETIHQQGKTIILTTHFMEEAESLCDRVAVIDRGHLLATDTPESLISSVHAETKITLTVKQSVHVESLERLDGVCRIETKGENLVIYGQGDRLVDEVVAFFSRTGVGYRDLHVHAPTLEDAFLNLTGRAMRD